jgi:hypothetical protein
MLRLLFALTLFALARLAAAQSLGVYENDFEQATFQSPGTLLVPALSAGASVAWSDYVSPTNGFGTNWQGYGHHYVVALADNVNGKFMRKLVFAAASHHEDNYLPNAGGFRTRIALAAAHTLYVSPGTNGWKLTWKTLNWSAIPASFAIAGLSNAYQPALQRDWSPTLKRVGTATAGYAAGNVLAAAFDALKQKHPRLSRILPTDRTQRLQEMRTPDSP